MENKYDNIQQLIAYWQEFEVENPSQNLSNFGQWLITERGNLNSASIPETHELPMKSENRNESEMEIGRQFLELISRLSRLQDFYTKKLFEGLPINNLLEFNFLFSINKNSTFKKKEIIDYNMVEYTTGIDIIKRLIKLHLVSEFPDQIDKRSKRLKMSSDGKRVLIDALLVINKIGHIFLGNQQDKRWTLCLQNLSELETHHKTIFSKASAGNGYNLLKIIQDENQYKSK